MSISDLTCTLKDLFAWIVERFFDLIDILIGTLVALLPATPFKFERLQWGDFGKLIGYFIPVADMLSSFTILLVSIGLWYAVRHLLRLIKMAR